MSRGHRKDDFAAARSHLHQGLGKNFDFGSITVDSVDRFCMGPLHVTFACLCIVLREMSESQRVSTRSSSCSVHSLHLFADAHTHTGPGKFYKGVGSIWQLDSRQKTFLLLHPTRPAWLRRSTHYWHTVHMSDIFFWHMSTTCSSFWGAADLIHALLKARWLTVAVRAETLSYYVTESYIIITYII